MKHSELMRQMIRQAVEKHDGKITPAVHKKTFDECFTEHDDSLVFWYNDPNNSTCAIISKIDPEAN